MSSLQDLVTETIQEPSNKERLDPLSALENKVRLHFDDLEDLFRSLPERISSAPSNEVPYLVAQGVVYLTLSSRDSHRQSSDKILVTAATYSYNEKSEYLEDIYSWIGNTLDWIKRERESLAEQSTIGGGEKQIIFLEEFFGDSLAKELSLLTAVKEATTKRWIRGHFSTSWGRHEQVRILAKIFYGLRYKKNFSDEESLAWYNSPFQGSSSPRNLLQKGGVVYSKKIREILSWVKSS